MLSKVTLKDPYTHGTLEAKLVGNPRGIELGFAGYGTHGTADRFGLPIYIELSNRKLTIHVWSDINQEDPTHVISMEQAREDQRKPRA